MSLAIDVDLVTAVLLADGWHEVANASFGLDSYEYLWWSGDQCKDAGDDPLVQQGGGQYGVCANGFAFTTTDGGGMAWPLTAILAVRFSPNVGCTKPGCKHLNRWEREHAR